MNKSQTFQNCCINGSAAPEVANQQVMDSETFNMMVTGFFSFIILFGLLGNCLIIITLYQWKNWKTSCNFLIANIAAADLGVVIIAAPLRIAERYLQWPSGLFLCNIVYPLQDVFVCVSIVTHSAIALERYRATVTPFKTRLSKKTTKFVILMIWVSCYVTTGIPQAIPGDLLETRQGPPCSLAIFSTPLNRRIFVIYQVLLFIVVQLLIQTVAYAIVIRTVRAKGNFLNMLASRDKPAPGLPLQSTDSRPSCTAMLIRVKKTKRLVKLLLVLVIAFQLCHLPRGASMLISEYSPDQTNGPAFYYVSMVFLALYYLKHVINPVILFAMSKEFQDSLKTCCKRETKATKNGTINGGQALCGMPEKEREDSDTFDEYTMTVKETAL